MSPEIPVRPRGAGIPAWLVALIAVIVVAAPVLLLSGGFGLVGDDPDAESPLTTRLAARVASLA